MKTRYLIVGAALLIVLFAAAAVYMVELGSIRSSAAQTFEVRANLIRQYIRLMRHNVYALQAGIEDRYRQLERGGSLAPELDAIRHHPEHGVWGISGLESEGGIPRLSGTLTGTEILRNPPDPVKKELTAVLDIDRQFQTLLVNVPDIIWVYYTSTNKFIYISPDPAVADFRFSEVLYDKEFWTQAEPANNPELEQIISDLYDDYYGQGLMISISSPVVLDGRFTGVASLDLGIDLLRDLTGIGTAAGESLLIDDNNRIVARVGDFELGERYNVPHGSGWIRGDDGAQWQSTVVAPGELRLLHRLPNSELYRAAAAKSGIIWVVLAAMLGLVMFSVRLNDALSRVRFLMNQDALTELLNRRGFTYLVTSRRSEAKSDGHRTALLMLDLDHFKKVNDTYGHEIGDQVLAEVARRLSAGVKEYDLVCRWGGEEILVFLVHDEAGTLEGIARRLRAAIEDRPVSEQGLHVTVSGGLTLWDWDESLDSAVDRADRLLYAAKEAGRNRIETDIRATQ